MDRLRISLGIGLFIIGWFINYHSDGVLRGLRREGAGYKIPTGGLFKYVTAANYFGESVEWAGFSLACSSPASLIFLFDNLCNLVPRAAQHHEWYLSKFKEYPADRKIFVPYIW